MKSKLSQPKHNINTPLTKAQPDSTVVAYLMSLTVHHLTPPDRNLTHSFDTIIRQIHKQLSFSIMEMKMN